MNELIQNEKTFDKASESKTSSAMHDGLHEELFNETIGAKNIAGSNMDGILPKIEMNAAATDKTACSTADLEKSVMSTGYMPDGARNYWTAAYRDGTLNQKIDEVNANLKENHSPYQVERTDFLFMESHVDGICVCKDGVKNFSSFVALEKPQPLDQVNDAIVRDAKDGKLASYPDWQRLNECGVLDSVIAKANENLKGVNNGRYQIGIGEMNGHQCVELFDRGLPVLSERCAIN